MNHAMPGSFAALLERELEPRVTAQSPLVLDLFAGCGGLALGFEAAGFRTVGYEMDQAACESYRRNLTGECHQVVLTESSEYESGATVIIGGPPCQPFSVFGHQRGHDDKRDGFPAFVSAVRRYEPQLALFENVRGMRYRSAKYLDEIKTTLRSLNYVVDELLLNAVEFGVPQRRQRLFVVAHRGSSFRPRRTALQYTAGDALGKMATRVPPGAQFLTPSMDKYVARYERKSMCARPRDLHLDSPSRTVTCRNLAAPTGDMLRVRLPDGRRRRLTVREGARLQAFPDWFRFYGTEKQRYYQIANAVPPLLAKAVAEAAWETMFSGVRLSTDEVTAANRRRTLGLFSGGPP